MKPLSQVVKSPSALDSWANYTGQTQFDGWECLVTQKRDSDCLERSNFRSALKALGGEGDNVEIHRFGHWACGWWEALAVKVGTAQHTLAQSIADKLEDYPVVNESDYGDLESEEADQIWKDCYRPKERIEYIRKHREQFDFRSCADILGCVRGKYFAGYASELIG